MHEMCPYGIFQRQQSQSHCQTKAPPPPLPPTLALQDRPMPATQPPPAQGHMAAFMPSQMPPLITQESQSEESQGSASSHIPPNSQLASQDPSNLQVVPYGGQPYTPTPKLAITPDQQPAVNPDTAIAPQAAAKAQIAEMTANMQRRFNERGQNINNSRSSKAGRNAAPKPPPKKTAPKTTRTTITAPSTKAAPAAKKGPGPPSANRSLITHEASRAQFLVRVAGASSKTFAYGNGKKRTMKQARLEAEHYLAKSLKPMK